MTITKTFTIGQIQAAHSKVKSGADFPHYVQELIQLGLISYDHFVCDGHTAYAGEYNYHIQSDAKYPVMEVAGKGDIEKLQHSLKTHQAGQTTYLEFCRQAAEAGVEKWTVDMQGMTCIYYDKAGSRMITEKIPQV